MTSGSRSSLLSLIGLLAVSAAFAAETSGSIDPEHISQAVRVLASDEFEGRAPGTPGEAKTMEWLTSRFRELGLEPGGERGSWTQSVPLVRTQIDSPATLGFAIQGKQRALTQSSDVYVSTVRKVDRVSISSAPVVFVGYGVTAPERQWDDYKKVDLRGKVAVYLINDPDFYARAGEPVAGRFGDRRMTYYGRWTYKFEEAARQGAAGAILIHTDESATYPWQVVQSSWTGTQYSLPPVAGAPALGIKAWMRNDAAKDLAKRGGRDLDELRAAAVKRGFKAVPLAVRADAALQQKAARKTSPNVVGILKGVNEREAVVFTSHYDHFGIRDPRPDDKPDADRIFNGAYDNASGLAGVLMIAQAMARAGEKPARSMLFVFTTAEESGLLGAEYFVQHPAIPHEQLAANINVDGINYLGSARDIVLLGADRSSLGPMAEALAKERGRAIGPDKHPERGYFFRSDHFPFAKVGVPALSISEPSEFTGPNAAELKKKQEAYNSTDYHQPSDQFDPAWDFSGAVEDMRLLAQLAWRIAAQPEMPRYNDGDQFANARKRT
jgi:Zn-dependent M28 family amino/carboxypeptidase